MPIERTLARVRAEVAAGELDTARDRLHGLILTYPERLDLRRELGDVYWRMGDRAMAGRFWYLEEPAAPEVRAAVAAFERRHGGDRGRISRALRFRGSLDAVSSPRAREALEGLGYRAAPPPARPRGAAARPHPVVRELLRFGCMALLALSVVLWGVGLVAVLRYIFGP
ncbi:MAG: hypothetical protein HY721_05340 [Planctomycetes bacterium]|nr:hypothetical protein [Planctomycetota bacterium]